MQLSSGSRRGLRRARPRSMPVVLEKAEGQAEQRGEEALRRLRAHRPRPGLSTEAIPALCRGEP